MLWPPLLRNVVLWSISSQGQSSLFSKKLYNSDSEWFLNSNHFKKIQSENEILNVFMAINMIKINQLLSEIR